MAYGQTAFSCDPLKMIIARFYQVLSANFLWESDVVYVANETKIKTKNHQILLSL